MSSPEPAFPTSEKYYLHVAVLLSLAFLVLVGGMVLANTKVGALWFSGVLGLVGAVLFLTAFRVAAGGQRTARR